MEDAALDLELLQGMIWDLYKEVYNVRPRHLTDAQWGDIQYLRALYKQCIDAL